MTIKENLTQYLDAFAHTNDIRNKGDISTFVYEFLDIIYKSYQKTEIYALEKKRAFETYDNIINQLMVFDSYKNKHQLKELLYILIQNSIFGDFGLSKTNLRKILNKGNTKITEILSILKGLNLVLDIQIGKHHYYKANLDELDVLV